MGKSSNNILSWHKGKPFSHCRPIYDLPVIYGMLWCTPNMVMDILVNKTNQLVDGQSIADLWPKIVEEEKIPVVFNQEITVKFDTFFFSIVLVKLSFRKSSKIGTTKL